jgi:Tol biopolymer transport system component
LAVVALAVGLIGASVAPTEGVATTATVDRQPDGQIVYVRVTPPFDERNETIWSMDAAGGNQTKLSNGPHDVAPAYSPSGRKIAFSSLRDTPDGWQGERLYYSELYVMNADGTNPERITFNEGLVDTQPTWSPDGDRILVARGPSIEPSIAHETGPTDLWIINLANGKERQLTNSPDTWEGYADWSPDGSTIVFESDLAEPGNFDLYTIRADGSRLRRLTSDRVWEAEPEYAPDGSHITFTNYDTFDVYTIGADGSGRQQLTHLGLNTQSVYSSDGRFFAFVSDRGYPEGGIVTTDIWVMRADGTQQTNLTRTPLDYELDPDWHRR